MDPQGTRTSGQRRMVVHYQIRQSLVFLLFASTIFTHLVYFTTALADLWEFTCWNHQGNYTEDSLYVKNLRTVLHHLKDTNNGYGFFNYSAGEDEGGPDAAYAVALCRGDVGPDDCQRCVDDATQRLRQVCPNQRGANGWYDTCLLNYANVTLLHTLDTIDVDPAGIGWDDKVSDLDEFKLSMESLFPTLQAEAANGDTLRKYAVGNTSEPTYGFLYGLMQCTPDLSEEQCNQCLTQSFNYSFNNPDTISRKYYRPNCLIRYGVHPFFNATWYPPPSSSPSPSALSLPIPPPSPEEAKKTNKSLIIGSVAAASTIGILILVFLFITFRRKSRGQGKDLPSETQVLSSNRFDRGAELQQMEGDKTGEMNYYSLTTIQGATDNFSPDNKLGEGGFGPVYRGKLDDGKEIAVKRLFKNSRQGLEEFKTEVQLIIKLQHKNLVQLLGYCIEGNERLLVYEYMPNTSVDAFLFDPTKCKELNWPRRANIAIGVAKGLRYLHEDSRLKIIHRDMKASNVLLDHEMNPKISDFGTARLFGANQIDANTSKIVGTYGYMAPEYAMEGVISIKSDVYSFGVLLLEMISGKRNMRFYNQEHRRNLLSNAWRLWRDGKGEELIDQNMIDECPVNEALRWIQIGLLCVQEDPNNRPTMSIVVFMLESQSMILAEPTEPPMGFGRPLAFDQSSTSAASTEVSSSYPKSTSTSHLLR